MKICIDPGHVKGYNPGVVSGYAEGTAMFTLGNYLKSALESYGASVIITRKSVTENPDLAVRGNMAKGCDMFISLHTNAAGSIAKPSSANFVVAYRSLKHDESKDLGDKLCAAVTNVMKAADSSTYSQGALTRKYSSTSNSDYYAVVRNACNHVKYAYLIEHGFHTNTKQCKWLNSDSNLKLIADAEAKVIAEYFGLKKTTITVNPTVKTETSVTTGILAPYEGTFRVSQQYKGSTHQGLDLVGVTSKKLFSRFNGKVEIASNADPNGFGTYVRLLVTDGPYTGCRVYFGHMSSVCVKVGDIVKIGQQVGVEGSTGRSTGSHCHYEVRATLSHSSYKDINAISGIPNAIGSYKSASFTTSDTVTSNSTTPSASTKTKFVRVLNDDTNIRKSLSWDDDAITGTVNKGEVFTVVSDKIKVEDGYMYKLKSGVYITASTKYVEVFEK